MQAIQLWRLTMAREFAKKFYKSDKWLKCRNDYIKKGYEHCEKEGIDKLRGILHHKKPLNSNNINNG